MRRTVVLLRGVDISLTLPSARPAYCPAAVLSYSDDRAAMRAYLSAADALDNSIERSTADGVRVIPEPIDSKPPTDPAPSTEPATAYGKVVRAPEHGD